LFKHALVQDAAYGTLLRDARRALHSRIAETLESDFADIAENQPEVLARHCTEAGLIEKASGLWGKAGQRSLARSALVEAVEQLTRGLAQIATLPTTPALRREEIKLQVALLNSLFHVQGYAAPETKAAVERARLLIEQAEALGEPLEDPLLLFAVLYGLFVQNIVAFNGDVCRDLASHILALGEKQGATVPLMIGHRIMGVTLVHAGNFAVSRAHLDRAFALYNPIEHRTLATRFGADTGVTTLGFRSLALWFLGYPEAALADADSAIRAAREIGQAATLMIALATATWTQNFCGNYAAARSFADELVALAAEKGAACWKPMGTLRQVDVLAESGKASATLQTITSALSAERLTGATTHNAWRLSHLARAYADIGQFDDAWRSVDEALNAVETTKEKMFEAEINRVAGEITLKAQQSDTERAQAHFERALTVARQQQAKSWELRASMSLARLWRDQGNVQQASELLAPVYEWFTEGFDTRDLKEAKALLEELGT
jgi:predicted ATPase